MKQKKRYLLIIGMLLIQVYTTLVIYGTEVRSVETEGTIGFTGVYETPGRPEPAPEGAIKPDLPKEIAQHPSESNHRTEKRLPKTNEKQMSAFWGLLLIIATLGFWFWINKKKKQIKKVGFK